MKKRQFLSLLLTALLLLCLLPVHARAEDGAGSKPKLTIRVLDQTCTYNAAAQGEYSTSAYTDPEVIKTKVEVSGLQDGDQLTSIKLYTDSAPPVDASEYKDVLCVEDGSVKITGPSGDTTGNYDIICIPGSLTIDPAVLTIKVLDQSFDYDGKQHYDNNTYTDPKEIAQKVQVSGLCGGDKLASITLSSAPVTDAGEYPDWISVVDYVVCDSSGNFIGNYYQTWDSHISGKLTINGPKVTVKVQDQVYPYDGNAHGQDYMTCSDPEEINKLVEVSGLPDNEKLSGIVLNTPHDFPVNAGVYKGYIDAGQCKVTDETSADVTGHYMYDVVPGDLTIEPIEVTVSVPDRTTDYSGSVQEGFSDYVFENLPEGYIATISYTPAAGKDTGSYSGSFDAESFRVVYGKDDVTINFKLAKQTPGSLTIQPLPMTVTVSGSSTEKPYNGKEQEYQGTVTASSNDSAFKEANFSYSGSVTAKGMNIGHYTAAPDQNACVYNDKNYTVNWEIDDPVKLTITPLNVKVYVEDAEDVVYDAQEHTGSDEVKFDGLVSGHEASVPYIPAKGTDAGSYQGAFTNNEFKVMDGKTDVTENYVPEFTDGKLTIKHRPITITGVDDTLQYNGSEQSARNECIFGNLVSGHHGIFGTDSYTPPSGTEPGSYDNGSFGDLDWAIEDDYHREYTDNYTLTETVPGKLTIIPIQKQVTIYGNHAECTYDNTEQTIELAWSWFGDPDLGSYCVYNGPYSVSGKEVGYYPLGMKPEDFSSRDPHYQVIATINDGGLTIKPAEITVTITGHTATATYLGMELSVNGYDVKCDSDLFNKDLVKYKGDAVASGTDVGRYLMNLDPDDFSYNDKNITVNWDITDGELQIIPAEVKVTVVGNHDSGPFDSYSHDVKGFYATCDNIAFKQYLVKYDGEAIAQGTETDIYPMNLNPEKFSYDSDNLVVTEWDVTDGYLEIYPGTWRYTVKYMLDGKEKESVTTEVTVSKTEDAVIQPGTLVEKKYSGYKFEAMVPDSVKEGSPFNDLDEIQFLYETVSGQEDDAEPETPETVSYSGSDLNWTKGSGTPAVAVFKRNTEDEKTFELFDSVKVDGQTVSPENYSAEKGSAVITLKAEYLETLSIAEHTLEADFKDGSAQVRLTILPAAADGTVKSPATGDMNGTVLWLALIGIGAIVLAGSGLAEKKRNR